MQCKELELIQLQQHGHALIDVENVWHQGIKPIRVLSEVVYLDNPPNLSKAELRTLGLILHSMIVDFEKHMQRLMDQAYPPKKTRLPQ